jgi:hypothetical protein
VLAGVSFTPHRPPHLSSELHASVEASLRRLRAQGLIAPTRQGRVALTALGDALLHSLVAWTGWPSYWATLVVQAQREAIKGNDPVWTWADARAELLPLLDRLTPQQAHDIVRHLLATQEQDLLAAELVGRVRRCVLRKGDTPPPHT